MAQLFANNAFGSLGATLSAVATTLTLGTGQGARFPTPTGGDHFLLTLVGLDTNGNENAWEIVRVTARSTDTLTVTRAQEGTTAALWASGTRVELRATAGTLDGLLQKVGGTVTGPVTISSGAYTAFKIGLTGLVSVGGEAGSAEAKFTVTDAGNVGLEVSPTAIAGAIRLLSYNRASMAFSPMTLMASEHKMNVSGSDIWTVSAGGVAYTGTLTGGTGVVNLGNGQFVKDAAGNFGLGGNPQANIRTALWGAGTTSATHSLIAYNSNGLPRLAVRDDGRIGFANDAMTVDAAGNLLVGVSFPGYQPTNAISIEGPLGYSVINHATGTPSGGLYMAFGYNAAGIGSITQSGTTAVTYNTTSDHRLKENVRPSNAARFIDIQFRDFEWVDGRHDCGVIAHELQAIYPDLVVGEKDATEIRTVEITPAQYETITIPAVLDAEGNEVEAERTEQKLIAEAVTEEREYPVYQQVNYTGLIGRMGTVVQQQHHKIEALQTQLDAQNAAMQLLADRLAALEAA